MDKEKIIYMDTDSVFIETKSNERINEVNFKIEKNNGYFYLYNNNVLIGKYTILMKLYIEMNKILLIED
jgi:hypothetical protein